MSGRFNQGPELDRALERPSFWGRDVPGFKRGGRVKRTGIYKLHAGERVIPARSKRRGRR